MRVKIIAIVLLTIFSLSGCAMNRYEALNLQDYPDSVKIFDLTFGWKQLQTDSGVTLNGYARNNRYPVIQDLELRVELLDKAHKVKAKEVFFFIPVTMPIDSFSPFTVKLAAKPEPGDIFRFVYRYTAVEGNDEIFTWFNSFEAPALPLP